MYLDPLYWLLIGAGMLLSLWAQFRVKSTFSRYAREVTSSGLTGAGVAKRILEGCTPTRLPERAKTHPPRGV